MSRSRKKHPGGGLTTAASDKWFKTSEHRKERRATKIAVAQGEDPPVVDYGNPYASAKDGKQYWIDHDPKWMRK